MQSKCELIDYKIPQFFYDVDIKNKEKKQRAVTIDNTVKISVSDKEQSKGIIWILIKAVDEEDEIKYGINIKGVFKFIDEIENEEEKQKILKEEGFRELYIKLCEALSQIQSITKQHLPSLPPIEEFFDMQ